MKEAKVFVASSELPDGMKVLPTKIKSSDDESEAEVMCVCVCVCVCVLC